MENENFFAVVVAATVAFYCLASGFLNVKTFPTFPFEIILKQLYQVMKVNLRPFLPPFQIQNLQQRNELEVLHKNKRDCSRIRDKNFYHQSCLAGKEKHSGNRHPSVERKCLKLGDWDQGRREGGGGGKTFRKIR